MEKEELVKLLSNAELDDNAKVEAIQKAIFHCRGEVKLGKQYAIPILKGLEKAYKELEKYRELKNKYFS